MACGQRYQQGQVLTLAVNDGGHELWCWTVSGRANNCGSQQWQGSSMEAEWGVGIMTMMQTTVGLVAAEVSRVAASTAP